MTAPDHLMPNDGHSFSYSCPDRLTLRCALLAWALLAVAGWGLVLLIWSLI